MEGINIEQLKEILDEKNKELKKDHVSKSDFQLLYTELTGLRARHAKISEKVAQLEDRNKELEAQVNKLIQKSTEANIIVNLPTEINIDLAEKAKSVCAGILDEDSSNIESAYRIPTRNPRTATIEVKMKSRTSAIEVLKNSIKLKNSNMSIHKDLTLSIRRKRGKFIPLMKFLRGKQPATIKKISLMDDKLYVDDKTFTWDLAKGLKSDDVNRMEIIEELFGEIPANLLNPEDCIQVQNDNVERMPVSTETDSFKSHKYVYGGKVNKAAAVTRRHAIIKGRPHVESN